MPKSANLSGIKSLRNYTIMEAAAVVAVSERTIRLWIKQGLPAMANERPTLVRGDALIAFIKSQRKARKKPVAQDEFYCLKCRAARKPAGRFVECELNGQRARLSAICETCDTIMHKPIAQTRLSSLAEVFDLTLNNAPKITEALAAE